MLGCRERTFHVDGHHYALVHATGLAPATTTPYEVRLDGERVWPEPDSPYPPSVVRTLRRRRGRSGSRGAPAASARRTSRRTRCARTSTRTAARSMRCACSPTSMCRAATPPSWPHALVLLGDQVYADEVSPEVARVTSARVRDTSVPPGETVANFEEYTRLYRAAWSRAAHPLAAVHGAVGHDLRRPRRPRRLEHVEVVGRRHARDGLVGRAHRRRASRRTGSTSTWGTCRRSTWREDELYARVRDVRGRRAAAARVRVPGRPRGRRARAGATAATSAARG